MTDDQATQSPNEEFLAQIYNALVSALNDDDNVHLPRYLIIVLDYDLIQAANVYDFGVVEVFEDLLKWLLINLSSTVELRKKELIKKRPGAVSTTMEPRLVWVTMLHHPHNTTLKKIFALTHKFNSSLENIISKDKRSHILKVHIEGNETNFKQNGDLTEIGQEKYWRAIDAQMADFDHGITDLVPMPAKQEKFSRPKMNSKYKWHNPQNY